MRVMCIHEAEWNTVLNQACESPVKFGEIYHVVQDVQEPDGLFYELQEFPNELFHSNLFIPLSGEEADMKEEEVEEHELATA